MAWTARRDTGRQTVRPPGCPTTHWVDSSRCASRATPCGEARHGPPSTTTSTPDKPSRVTTTTQRRRRCRRSLRAAVPGRLGPPHYVHGPVRGRGLPRTRTPPWVASVTGYDEQGLTRFTMPVGADPELRDPGGQRGPRRRRAPVHPGQLRRCRASRWKPRTPRRLRRLRPPPGPTAVTVTLVHPPVGGETLTSTNGLGSDPPLQGGAVRRHRCGRARVLEATHVRLKPRRGQLAGITATHQDGAAAVTGGATPTTGSASG